MTPEDAAAQFRAEIVAGRRRSVERLMRAYERAWAALDERLDAIAARIAAAQAAGTPPAVAWEAQAQAYQAWRSQLAAAIERLAARAGDDATAQQRALVRRAAQYARRAAERAGAQVARRMPLAALEAYVGMAGDGTPLKTSFEKLGRDLAQSAARRADQAWQAAQAEAVAQALELGVALELNPRALRARARAAVDGSERPLDRSDITRRLDLAVHSAALGAARAAALGQMAAVGVKRWRWSAARSATTCAACYANHGRTFAVTEPMGAHPNCKCVPVPVSESWRDIVGDAAASLTGAELAREHRNGEALFSLEPPERQRQILGRAAWEAYRDGRLAFIGDLAAQRATPYGAQWGVGRLADIVGTAAARAYLRGESPPPDGKTARRRIEEQMVERGDEYAIVADDADNVLLRARGLGGAIWVTPDASRRLEGKTLVHNHPGGESLSPDDLWFAAHHQLAAIEALGRTPQGPVRYRFEAPLVTLPSGRRRRDYPAPTEALRRQAAEAMEDAYRQSPLPGWMHRAWTALLAVWRRDGAARGLRYAVTPL